MYIFKQKSIYVLPVLFALIFFSACGTTQPASEADDTALELLREIQAELAELRAENNELRENNAELMQNLEELRDTEMRDTGLAEMGSTPDQITVIVETPPAPPPIIHNPPAVTTPAVGDTNINIEIIIPENTPKPSPTPAPTPAPASLVGRWVTVGAVRSGIPIHVPPEESMEIDFFSNGNGMMNINGIGNMFTWTGGDTGAIGRIVITFGSGFGSSDQSETMTYRISGTQMGLTHTMFGYEPTTTFLVKAE